MNKCVRSVAIFSWLCIGANQYSVAALPKFYSDVSAGAGQGLGAGDINNKIGANAVGAPSSISHSHTVPSGLSGLGQPSAYTSSASATAAPYGGPISDVAPFVLADAHSEGAIPAEAHAILFYYFAVEGPANTQVPVRADFIFRSIAGQFYNGEILYNSIEGNATYNYFIAESSGNYSPAMSNSYQCGAPYATECNGGAYQSTSNSGFVKSNTSYMIGLEVNAFTWNRSTSGLGINYSFAAGYLDPYIAIDGSFGSANQYTMSFSVGIKNSPLPAIPEQNIWILLLVGLVGLHFMKLNKQG